MALHRPTTARHCFKQHQPASGLGLHDPGHLPATCHDMFTILRILAHAESFIAFYYAIYVNFGSFVFTKCSSYTDLYITN